MSRPETTIFGSLSSQPASKARSLGDFSRMSNPPPSGGGEWDPSQVRDVAWLLGFCAPLRHPIAKPLIRYSALFSEVYAAWLILPCASDKRGLPVLRVPVSFSQSPLLLLRHSLWDRHYRQGREDAVDGIQLHGHSGEHPLSWRGAAHRPREVGRIGPGEYLVDEPGRLPVGR